MYGIWLVSSQKQLKLSTLMFTGDHCEVYDTLYHQFFEPSFKFQCGTFGIDWLS